MNATTLDLDVTQQDAWVRITNPKTGGRIELRVKTQPEGAWKAGERIASVSTTRNHWESFAFVDPFGLHVWTSKASNETIRKYADMLETPSKWRARGLVYQVFPL